MESSSGGRMMEINNIVVGDCTDVIRGMPDGCVQTVVTSPPYWGLRDYGNPPRVWGGEAGCEHEWAVVQRKGQTGGDGRSSGLNCGRDDDGRFHVDNKSVVCTAKYLQSSFCRHCNAWRGCLGLEPTPKLYVAHLVEIFREVKRVLRKDGTVWLNMGDSYAGSGGGHEPHHARTAPTLECHGSEKGRQPIPVSAGLKQKDLVGIPWRVAFALQADGWWLRSDIIWHKPNCMPESVRDRPITSHEHIFLLAKSRRYFYDADAIGEPVQPQSVARGKRREQLIKRTGRGALHKLEASLENGDGYNHAYAGLADGRSGSGINPAGRNKRTVWTTPTQPYSGAHFAVFPEALIEPCIKAGTSERGACPECGAPWARVVERGEPVQQHWAPGTQEKVDKAQGDHGKSSVFNTGFVLTRLTVGWRPTCTCYGTEPFPKIPKRDKKGGETEEAHAERIVPIKAERLRLLGEWEPLPTVPCLVFDPFMGAGTTALVALKLGRVYYGSEINPEYVKLAEERLADVQLRLF